MKKHTLPILVALAAAITASRAADIYKADNLDDLNLASSWTNGVAPGADDVAVWDADVLNAVPQNLLLGADTTWRGIRILNPASAVTINAGNTLTLGAAGLDTSSGSQGITLANALTIGAPQNWNVVLPVTVSGVISGEAGNAVTNIGAGTLTISGANNSFVDGIVINAGVVNLTAGSSMPFTLNGGQLSVGAAIGNPVRGTPNGGIIRVTANRTLSGPITGMGVITFYVTGSGTSATVNGDLSGFTGRFEHGPSSTGSIRANTGAFVGSGNIFWDFGPTGGFTRNNSAAVINFGAMAGGTGSRIAGGGVTYVIGQLDTDTTFSGDIQNCSIIKVGTGTLTLDGTSTFAGGTTISNGVLQIGSGGASGALGAGPVTNYSALTFNRDGELLFPNLITGTGPVTNIGPGIVSLTGANTYSGETYVNAGKLFVGTPSLVTSLYTVADGAGLGALVTSAGAMLTQGSVTFGSGCGYDFDLGIFGNPAGTVVTNTGTVTLNGNVTVNLLGTNFTSGTITLLRYANRAGAGSFVLGALPPNVSLVSFNDDTVNKEVRVTISVGVIVDTTLKWLGGAAGEWDIDNSANQIWRVVGTGQDTNYYEGAAVLFDDGASGTTDVNVTAGVNPASVTVSNATKSYTLLGGGSIFGSADLTKKGTGELVVSNANFYSGVTAIENGTVRLVGDASSIGSGAVTNNGAFVIDRTEVSFLPSVLAFFNQITGTGSFSYLGIDTNNSILEIEVGTADGNPFSGGTIISNGYVRLNANPASDATRSAAKSTGLGTGTITFLGGSVLELEDFGVGNNGAQSGNFSAPLNVPAGQDGSLLTGGRMTVSGPLTGSGTFNLVVSYIRCVISGDYSAFEGQLNLSPSPNGTGNQYQIANAAGLPLAKVNIAPGVTMGGNSPLPNSSTVPIGELTMEPGSFVNSVGETPRTAIFSVGGLNTSSAIAGDIAGPHSWVKVGTGTLTFSGVNTYTGNTTVSNGVIAFIGETGASNSANITVASPGILDVSGRTDGTLWLGAGEAAQTLRGDGEVHGSVSVGALGTVSPGFSIGTLTVTNALTLGGTTFMELNRTNGSATNDLIVAHSITAGGTLRVTNIGPALVAGDTFKLFNAPVSGFTSIELPTTDASLYTYTWTTNLATDGSITVATATPGVNTAPTNIVFSSSGGSLDLQWPDDYKGWTLQTNSVGITASASWFDFPPDTGSRDTNHVTITISPDQSNVFFRLVYP